jgi:hypothetical protein
MALCAGAVAASSLCIAMVFMPRSRDKPSPTGLVARLLDYETEGGDESEAEAIFIRDNAQRYARVIEENNKVNTKISRWLVRVSVATLAALTFFGILIATLFIVFLKF